MTRASDDKRVRRETAAAFRQGREFRPLIVEIGAQALRIRLKGCRYFYEVDYKSIFDLGGKKEAQRRREEKKLKRRGKLGA